MLAKYSANVEIFPSCFFPHVPLFFVLVGADSFPVLKMFPQSNAITRFSNN